MGSNSSRVQRGNRNKHVRRLRRAILATRRLRDSDIARIPRAPSRKTAITPDAPPPCPPLLDLPAEMQLHVLSFLPARYIQRCRRVNKHFRCLIDLKDNRSLSLKPGIDASLRRLNESITRFCYYPTDTVAKDGMPTAFLRAFADFFDNTLQDDTFIDDASEESLAKCCWLGKMFWYHWHTSAFPQDAPLYAEQWAALWHIAMQFINAAGNNIIPLTTDQRACYEALKLAILALPIAHRFFGAATPEQMLKVFDIAEKNLLDGHELFVFGNSPQKFRLVRIPSHGKYNKAPKYRQKCRASERELADLLQVPSLPATAPVTYCTTSRSAWILIKSALRDGEVLSPVKRAALLEELVVA
ncbi:hypothetical protein BST61_g11597 [Cercospora zeina]